jgi:lipooligosaccharide transport system permease protein
MPPPSRPLALDPRDILRVWLRYFAVFRKSLLYGITVTITQPLLFLLAFGFGLASLIPGVDYRGVELGYREFVFAGIIAQALLLQGYFEGAFGSFVRMYYQRVFQSVAVTPVTLREVLWAELLWDASRASFSALVIAGIGSVLGILDPWSWLRLIPVVVVGGLTFSALGVLSAAFARTIEELNYPQYFLVFPMFVFCGIFYPIANLPAWIQPVVQLLPLAGLADLVRSITLGLPLQWGSLAVLLVWFIVLVPAAHHAMTRRLVK